MNSPEKGGSHDVPWYYSPLDKDLLYWSLKMRDQSERLRQSLDALETSLDPEQQPHRRQPQEDE